MKKTVYLILIAIIITVLAIVIVLPGTALAGCEDACDHNYKNKKNLSKCLDSCKKGALKTDEKSRKCSERCRGTLSTESYSNCFQKCKKASDGK